MKIILAYVIHYVICIAADKKLYEKTNLRELQKSLLKKALND